MVATRKFQKGKKEGKIFLQLLSAYVIFAMLEITWWPLGTLPFPSC